MAPKVKSATALAKEAADAAAAAAGGHEDSFADAEEDTDPVMAMNASMCNSE